MNKVGIERFLFYKKKMKLTINLSFFVKTIDKPIMTRIIPMRIINLTMIILVIFELYNICIYYKFYLFKVDLTYHFFFLYAIVGKSAM